jgi:hypothetical protein
VLAYSLVSCLTPTPSVQVPGQGMAMCAARMKERYAIRKGNTDVPERMIEKSFLKEFITMLRYLYVYAAAGVFFTNAVPIPVDTAAKRIRVSSYFTE